VPESAPASTFWEHVYRYRFASAYVRDKDVLDVACGEGYGAAGLASAGARTVLAVDISADACLLAHARHGVTSVQASAEKLPLASDSVDIVISFETIEHLEHPDKFIAECARTIRPDGLLIISTPNGSVERRTREAPNEFHINVFDLDAFIGLVSQRFRVLNVYSQRPVRLSQWCSYALCMDDTPWLSRHGFWRLREALRRRARPDVWASPDAGLRLEASKVITQRNNWASRLVNPYLVRRFPGKEREEPTYYILLARPCGAGGL